MSSSSFLVDPFQSQSPSSSCCLSLQEEEVLLLPPQMIYAPSCLENMPNWRSHSTKGVGFGRVSSGIPRSLFLSLSLSLFVAAACASKGFKQTMDLLSWRPPCLIKARTEETKRKSTTALIMANGPRHFEFQTHRVLPQCVQRVHSVQSAVRCPLVCPDALWDADYTHSVMS